MARTAVFALVLVSVPGLASASVEVRQQGAKVSVHAQAAALPEVLERLAKATGMKVVYEGARPQTLVNASLDDRTPAEAVLTVLEGLGLNFLARMDVTGSRVEHLVIAGVASASPAATPAAAAARATPVVAEEDGEEEEEPAEEAKPEPPRPAGMMLGARPRPLPGQTETPANSVPAVNLPTYPTSPFAPQGPAPPTVVLPQPPPDPVEEPEDDGSLQ